MTTPTRGENACTAAYANDDIQTACDQIGDSNRPKCCDAAEGANKGLPAEIRCLTECSQDCDARAQVYARVWFGAPEFPSVKVCTDDTHVNTAEEDLACILVGLQNHETAEINEAAAKDTKSMVASVLQLLNGQNCIAKAFNKSSGLSQGDPFYVESVNVDAVQAAIEEAVDINPSPSEKMMEKVIGYAIAIAVIWFAYNALSKKGTAGASP